MKAYSYIRFSSKRQADGHSLKRQLEAARAYCERHNLFLDESLSYRDLGVSAFRGKNAEEGDLKAFLSAIDEGIIDRGSTLIVESFDRLSRQKLNKAAEIFLRIINSGIEIVTLTPEDRFTESECDLVQIMAALMVLARGHEESSVKSYRGSKVWNAKQKQAREEGTIATAKIPTWLKVNGNSFEVVPEHVATIRRIFDLSQEGYGSGEITQQLNAANTPNIGRCKSWNKTQVRFLLTGRAVLGEYQPTMIKDGKRVPAGDPIPNYYPAVIDEDTWLRSQECVKSRATRTKGRKSDFVNLFRGMIFDAGDKGNWVIGNKGIGRVYFPYRSDQFKASRTFPVELIEAAFLRMTKELSPADLKPNKAKHDRTNQLETELARYNLQISEIEKEIENATGSIKLLLSQLTKLEAKRDAVHEDLNAIRSRSLTNDATSLDQTKHLFAVLQTAPKQEQNALRIKLRGLISSTVDEIWAYVFPFPHEKSRDRMCRMQVFFKAGGFRQIDILKPCGNRRTRTPEVTFTAWKSVTSAPMETEDLRIGVPGWIKDFSIPGWIKDTYSNSKN